MTELQAAELIKILQNIQFCVGWLVGLLTVSVVLTEIRGRHR